MCHHKNGRRVARSCVVDNVLQPHGISRRNTFIDEPTSARFWRTSPLIGFIDIVQAKVVVDRLWGKNAGDNLGNGLHTVDCAVAADANQTVKFQLPDVSSHKFQFVGAGFIQVGSGRPQKSSTFTGVQFRDRGEQGIQMYVRDSGIEQSRVSSL